MEIDYLTEAQIENERAAINFWFSLKKSERAHGKYYTIYDEDGNEVGKIAKAFYSFERH